VAFECSEMNVIVFSLLNWHTHTHTHARTHAHARKYVSCLYAVWLFVLYNLHINVIIVEWYGNGTEPHCRVVTITRKNIEKCYYSNQPLAEIKSRRIRYYGDVDAKVNFYQAERQLSVRWHADKLEQHSDSWPFKSHGVIRTSAWRSERHIRCFFWRTSQAVAIYIRFHRKHGQLSGRHQIVVEKAHNLNLDR